MPGDRLLKMDLIEQTRRSRIAAEEAIVASLQRVDRRCTWGRAAAFLTLLAVGFVAWHGECSWWWLAVPTVALVAAALGNELALERLAVSRMIVALQRRQLARRGRRWDELPVPEAPGEIDEPHVARDLDVFGVRSVFQWLCLARTPIGRQTLARWLMTPVDVATIAQRQHVVRELASEREWRESLELHANLLGDAAVSGRQFLEWGESPGWLATRPLLRGYARIAPLLACVVLGLRAAGGLDASLTIGLLVAVLVVNLIVAVLFTGDVHDVFDRVSRRGDEVGHYREMLSVATQLPQSVGRCDVPVRVGADASGESRDLREVAAEGLAGLASLQRITTVANARRSGFWAILVFVAHAAILWEFHVLDWLESWQRRFGLHVAAWLDVIGRLEAFNSLAAVAHDEPDWCFPEVRDDLPTLRAEAIGHPLLSSDRRVTNDVTIGPAGSLLLVTGSNMSGKSTLLRSIGVNVLLARTGGPVCARRFELPSVEVQTSMRVADSLADGVSFFFAELLRLKHVVERARAAHQSGRRLLYLLDEILQGTNSRERQIAVIHVIRHLLEHDALGAVSTHDLELASHPDLVRACHTAHFRETITGAGPDRTMTFDYLLRPGVSPTTNALVLLDMVGLGE